MLNPTIIGNDVWIGQNAVILPGVHISDGAIIGANSVVGSDLAKVKAELAKRSEPDSDLTPEDDDEL